VRVIQWTNEVSGHFRKVVRRRFSRIFHHPSFHDHLDYLVTEMLLISTKYLVALHLLTLPFSSSSSLLRRQAPECLGITDPARCAALSGCTYYNKGCHRDVNCVQAVDFRCSVGCQSCTKYGCIPANEQCPIDCTTITVQASCTTGIVANGIQCVWDAQKQTCGFSTPVIFDPRFSPAVAGLAAAFQQEQQRQQANGLAAQNPAGPQPPKSDAANGNDGSGIRASTPTPITASSSNAEGLNTLHQSGGIGKWPVYVGGAVGMVALAGIAVLAVHKAKKTREANQDMARHRTAGQKPIFQRQSFLPGVQRALDNVSSVKPAYVREMR
jgi:heme exporter protein D